MNLSSEGLQLPAYSIAEEVNQQLQKHNRLIITADPGAGKSTLLPLTILNGSPSESDKVLMLEPRRLAAKQIAERMAYLIGEKCGETVGYRVRFENRISADTRIEVLTEGILSRMLVNNPMLEGVSTVIFDEFHERSINSDVALALTREIQQVIRPDLRIILMSATIDASALSDALDAPVIDCEGRMFPVDIRHTEEDVTPENVSERTAHYIRKAHAQQQGDILVFLPGQAEILRCQELLGSSLNNTDVYPLYGQLPPQQQRQAILPSPTDRRKVVLATSIAETSLTIEGVRIVVDAGLCRSMVFDPRNGLNHMVTQRITMDMATQRSGRAGRLCEGICYRLWTLATEHRMEACREAEILHSDLASPLLSIIAWGENDIKRLPWITPPPSGNVSQALQMLTLLGAIDKEKKITTLGHAMSELPCHPRIAKMLLSEDHPKTQSNVIAIASDIAAITEEKDPLNDDEDADINTRIASLRSVRKKGEQGRWSRIIRIAQDYRRIKHIEEDNGIPSPFKVGALIANAYPERIARSIDGCGRYRMANGETARLSQNDELSSHNWLAIASMNSTSGKVFLAAPLDPQEIPQLITEKQNVSWDSKSGSLVMQLEKRIGSIVVESKPIHQVDRTTLIDLLCTAAKRDGLSMFDFNEEVQRLQRRIAAVAEWHPELELPDVSTEGILQQADRWLPFYAENNSANNNKVMTTSADLKKIDLKSAIWTLLTYEQQQEVDRLAPTHISVPTGSKIRIDYRTGAEAPVLSVRLQECFGLTETPRVNDGQQPLLMELLSPGFKPVQLTQDLQSFWTNTYFEVRKELKRRYPKHFWPDNPLEAKATKRVKN